MKMFVIPVMASALALAACGETTEEAVPSDTADMAETDAAADVGTIVDVASGNEDFSTLVTAVQAAELVETLSGDGPFTVFAPTNAAFTKLPEGTLEELTKPENKAALVGILTYHVVAGETSAEQLIAAIEAGDGSTELSTVNGTKLTATLVGEAVVLRDAAGNASTVTATDIDASNGVVHVIDTVVMPG
ncbi:fasciclin domain-containing protein [Pontixanthobacter sp.]|uniref:fasciclin domain-containing protein n=1 Tax=Pontixanthobacter sp. TaxID=2792078 RepID=UPI003C7A3E0E